MFPNWNWTMLAISASFHSVAILSTVFRLWYRWYTACMWWDDAWAMVVLLADFACLTMTALQQPIPGDVFPRFFFSGLWVLSLAYPTLMWASRISILTSLMHVSYPEGMLRRISIGVGATFGVMAVAMLAQRLQNCITNQCLMRRELLISQTTTDCIADVLLTALPLWCLRDINLKRKRKILILSTFSASMIINIVTVTQAIAFFRSLSSGSIIFEHVKVACSMISCNLLVIVTFLYRILHRGEIGLESETEKSEYQLTTVDLTSLAGFSQEASKGKSVSTPSGKTKSSTWSFRAGGRSNASVSVTAATSWIDTLSGGREKASHNMGQQTGPV